jgi:hypothetical protein
MSGIEAALIIVTAYFMAGAMKVTQDFKADLIDAPGYVRQPRPLVTFYAWLLWWRRQSVMTVVSLLGGCAAVTWGVGWVMHFLTTNLVIQYGVAFAFVIWSMLPFLQKQKTAV